MNEGTNLTLRTRTPLWTGGVEPGRMDRLHEVGIIGSLRWWYEAIVRALGGDACNPTAEDAGSRCPRSDGSYCDVCRLFGATGRARAFRLRLDAADRLFDGNGKRLLLPSGRVHPSRNPDAPPRVGGWFLFGDAAMGSLSGSLLPLMANDETGRLQVPLALIVRHAALGAKVSNGYGVVVEDPPARLTTVTADDLRVLPSGGNTYTGLPDLRDFFFARLSFQPPPNDPGWWQDVPGLYEAGTGEVQTEQGVVINVYHRDRKRNRTERDTAREELKLAAQRGVVALAPAVRNWLRYQWPNGLTDSQKRYLFGSIGPSVASKINVSHAYTTTQGVWEFRVWGWIPCQQIDTKLDRDAFLGQLKTTLHAPATWYAALGTTALTPSLDVWHSRTCDQRDGHAYLEQLLDLSTGGTP